MILLKSFFDTTCDLEIVESSKNDQKSQPKNNHKKNIIVGSDKSTFNMIKHKSKALFEKIDHKTICKSTTKRIKKLRKSFTKQNPLVD